MITVRPAGSADNHAIWAILEPTIRAGENLHLAAGVGTNRKLSRIWLSPSHTVFVAEEERAVHLWRKFGFDIVGSVPNAFLHPHLGYVDALIMYRTL